MGNFGAQKQAKKKKLEGSTAGQQYAVGTVGDPSLGVTQAHELLAKQGEANRLAAGDGDTKGAGIGGQLAAGKKVKGRSDKKRQKAGVSVAAIDKTIIGSSGKKLGA